ncbi:bile acid-sensitive ion channel-like isoform X3 [Branchiostoma floridae x Branchiostoma belcheri]
MSPEDDKESPEKAFAGNTSLHGFNRIASSPGGSPRVLWVIAILGSYTGFGYMFGSMMASYFKYDTITDTTLEFADELLFPAVTICNMNKFDSDKLQVADWSYLSLFLYGIQADIPTILALGVPLDETVNSTMTGVKIEDLVLAKGFNVSPNRMSLCWWRGTNCSERNFTHSFGHYGNCYTFNADADNPLKQTMPGAVNGFMAFVDIKEDKYTESFLVSWNAEVGLKLLVHDPREPPMMDTQGIALAPGNHAFIAIKQILYENHVPPWGVCKDLQLEYYDTYTLNGCYLECRSKHVVRNCSCRPYDLPGTAPSCDPTTMFTCVRAVLAQVITGDLKCDCPVPCRMTSYSTSLSFAGFPNKHTREYLAPLLGMEPGYMA